MGEASRSVAVVGWDMSHNALARSWMLADVLRHRGWQVQLAGPLCLAGTVWAPLREAAPPVETFTCRGMVDVIRQCAAHVEANPHRVVVVSKSRFPSMLLGLLYKRRWGARVVVDLDDFELALTGANKPLPPGVMRHPPGNKLPQQVDHPMWARIAEGMLDMADAVTVAGIGLQQRYGGEIARHARDPRVFDPSLHDPQAMRERFGLPARGRLVMFLGTPRAHKGVDELLSFIQASGAPDLVLCVTDRFNKPEMRHQLLARGGNRLVLMPQVLLADVPALLCTASLVCFPQDEASPISRYQVPAKLSDAFAMGVPVLMAPTAAVADLAPLGVFVNEGALDAAAFARAVALPQEALSEVVTRAHRVFVEQFTYEAVGAVLDRCVGAVESKPLPAWAADVFATVDQVVRRRQYP